MSALLTTLTTVACACNPLRMRINGVVGIALVVLVAGVAFADDESDRNDIVRNIDDKVDKVASEVYGFDGDSDDRDIDDAVSIARELKETLCPNSIG